MDTITPYKTHASVMHRVPKSDINIYGTEQVIDIPNDQVCIIAFGGENTRTIKDANYYASMLNSLIEYYKLSNVGIYSVYYDFEPASIDRKNERKNAFINARHKLITKDGDVPTIDTNYINDLYKMVILPRITDKNGNKLSDNAALQNIRKCILFAHCHGAATIRAFQQKMKSDMQKLGYTSTGARQIMRNLLVIQHAPASPLEKSLFNTVSFMSANDTQINFHNTFSEYVSNHNEDLLPSYFTPGNFFATYSFTHQLINEHQIIGLVPNKDQDILNSDGATIMAAERNAIINGIVAAKNSAQIPDIRDLITATTKSDTVRPDFDTLAENGKSFLSLMRHDLRTKQSNER